MHILHNYSAKRGIGEIKNKWLGGKNVKLRELKTVFHFPPLLGEKKNKKYVGEGEK